jgi:hypothetical protein
MNAHGRSMDLFKLLVLWFFLSLPAGVVTAQPSAQTGQMSEQQESRSRVFQTIEGARGEEISGKELLLVAYALFWLLLFAYLLRLGRLQAKTRADIDRLERLLANVKDPTEIDDGRA